MNCPACEVKLKCGCKSCQNNFPKKEDEFYTLSYKYEIDCDYCENCGLIMHLDQWLDVSMEEL